VEQHGSYNYPSLSDVERRTASIELLNFGIQVEKRVAQSLSQPFPNGGFPDTTHADEENLHDAGWSSAIIQHPVPVLTDFATGLHC